jgi:hypothetical protein
MVRVILVETTTPLRMRPRIDTLPVKGHFLSMYVPCKHETAKRHQQRRWSRSPRSTPCARTEHVRHPIPLAGPGAEWWLPRPPVSAANRFSASSP